MTSKFANLSLKQLVLSKQVPKTTPSKRLETSRLFHRFGFGPRPGEYALALKNGFIPTRKKLLTPPNSDLGATKVSDPIITDLGKRPEPNTSDVVPFAIAMRSQSQELTLWWLDKMTLSDHGLTEKMTWFWHGHWATSIQKLNYPLPMYNQNITFRTHALGRWRPSILARWSRKHL